MAKAKTKKKAVPKKITAESKSIINKAADKRAAKEAASKKHLASKKEVELALDGRKKLVLQKRNKDTIVYCRMKPPMFEIFEEAYAKYVTDNLLNPASYGMSTFVRENAFANLKAKRAI